MVADPGPSRPCPGCNRPRKSVPRADGFVVSLYGVNIPAQAHVGVAPVVVWLGILPIQADGFAVVFDGLLGVAYAVVAVAAVEIRLSVLRVIADRQIISGDGFLEAPLLQKAEGPDCNIGPRPRYVDGCDGPNS